VFEQVLCPLARHVSHVPTTKKKKQLFIDELLERTMKTNHTHISVSQLALSPLHNSMECNQFPYKDAQNLEKELELYGNFLLCKHTQTCRGLSTSVPGNRRPLRILHPKWKKTQLNIPFWATKDKASLGLDSGITGPTKNMWVPSSITFSKDMSPLSIAWNG
jgi:hypothetical protein